MRWGILSSLIFASLFGLSAGCTKQGVSKPDSARDKPKVVVDVNVPSSVPDTKPVKPAHTDEGPMPSVEGPVTSQPSGPIGAPRADVPAPPATLPKVVLMESLRQTCLVQTDDTMPPAELKGIDGQALPWNELLGKRLTVVFLWNATGSSQSRTIAATALKDLDSAVASPLGDKGVKVVAINVGDDAAAIKEVAGDVKFPVLCDADSAYFAKVAKKHLPRIYLLDANGKIVWFDLEYSRITRRDLHQALALLLAQ